MHQIRQQKPQRLHDLAARGAVGLQIPLPNPARALPAAWVERLDAINFGEKRAPGLIDPAVVEELRQFFINAPSERLRGLALGLLYAYVNLT